MQHPFAGILKTDEPKKSPADISRRTALAAAAATGILVSQGRLLGDEPATEKTEETDAAEETFSAYLVVPKDRRSFKAVAEKLGVQGPFVKGFPNSENLKDKGGFMAWATADIAKTIAADAGVEEVIPVTGADKSIPQKVGKGPATFNVILMPNTWPSAPPEETFTPAEDLVEAWAADDKLKELGATFKAVGRGRTNLVSVGITKDGDAEAVLKALADQPQVMAVMAEIRATTLALGEEGGGGVTTQALGEEGAGGGATTEALGEEGGPRPSTRALGEEGGRPQITTKALGEEGGGGQLTTQALGEEGGNR